MVLRLNIDNAREKKRKIIIGLFFVLMAILTWLVYANLWMMSLYHMILLLFGIISFCLGLWFVVSNRFSWRSIMFAFIVLLIGQWWLVEQLFVKITWGLKGMAP